MWIADSTYISSSQYKFECRFNYVIYYNDYIWRIDAALLAQTRNTAITMGTAIPHTASRMLLYLTRRGHTVCYIFIQIRINASI